MDLKKNLNEHGPTAGLVNNFIGTEENQQAEIPGLLNQIKPLIWILMASVGMGGCTLLMS
jgi:hypothetical protein